MGKIVGLGGGDCFNEAQNIYEYIIRLSGKKNPKVIILPTAHSDEPDCCIEEAAFFKTKDCETSYLRITKCSKEETKAAIDGADIIYLSGGNLEILMNALRESGADIALKDAFERGAVLCGSSSGMMCWFEEGYDDCGPEGSFMWIKCLGFLPYTACPHFEGVSWSSFENAVKGRELSGMALENDCALVYIDGDYSVMSGSEGGRAYVFDKDKGHKKEIFGGAPKLDDDEI